MLSTEALATGCGTKSDLIIGSNSTAVLPASGSGGEAAMNPGGQAGAAPVPDAADCGADPATPQDSLRHRYSFEGTGAVAKDSVGSADGELLSLVNGNPSDAGSGATLDGTGQLVLDGSTGYVNLPNGLISPLTDVSVVTWLKWSGGSGYQRIFDFGGGLVEDDTSKGGHSYFALSPYGGASRLLILTKGPDSAEVKLSSTGELKDGKEHQIAAIFVSSSHVELFLDGVSLGRADISFALSQIADMNDWLGRSQYAADNPFNGAIDELRIYARALTACEVQALNVSGPNAL